MTTHEPEAEHDEVGERVRALEEGASSWAALVGEDVRKMRQDLDALTAEVEALKARLG